MPFPAVPRRASARPWPADAGAGDRSPPWQDGDGCGGPDLTHRADVQGSAVLQDISQSVHTLIGPQERQCAPSSTTPPGWRPRRCRAVARRHRGLLRSPPSDSRDRGAAGTPWRRPPATRHAGCPVPAPRGRALGVTSTSAPGRNPQFPVDDPGAVRTVPAAACPLPAPICHLSIEGANPFPLEYRGVRFSRAIHHCYPIGCEDWSQRTVSTPPS